MYKNKWQVTGHGTQSLMWVHPLNRVHIHFIPSPAYWNGITHYTYFKMWATDLLIA